MGQGGETGLSAPRLDARWCGSTSVSIAGCRALRPVGLRAHGVEVAHPGPGRRFFDAASGVEAVVLPIPVGPLRGPRVRHVFIRVNSVRLDGIVVVSYQDSVRVRCCPPPRSAFPSACPVACDLMMPTAVDSPVVRNRSQLHAAGLPVVLRTERGSRLVDPSGDAVERSMHASSSVGCVRSSLQSGGFAGIGLGGLAPAPSAAAVLRG